MFQNGHGSSLPRFPPRTKGPPARRVVDSRVQPVDKTLRRPPAQLRSQTVGAQVGPLGLELHLVATEVPSAPLFPAVVRIFFSSFEVGLDLVQGGGRLVHVDLEAGGCMDVRLDHPHVRPADGLEVRVLRGERDLIRDTLPVLCLLEGRADGRERRWPGHAAGTAAQGRAKRRHQHHHPRLERVQTCISPDHPINQTGATVSARPAVVCERRDSANRVAHSPIWLAQPDEQG